MARSTTWAALLRALSLMSLGGSALAGNELCTHGPNWQPHRILRVTEQNVTLSCESRYSSVVNGTHPGPPLRIPEGKTTWIRVYNDMPDQNLTMHWHGLALYTAPFSDGSPSASQWPIPPLHYFDYELYPQKGSAGSYFYHSHVGMQANTAIGPLIVEDERKPPYQYDEDRVVFFSDYFNRTDADMEAGLVANPFVWEGEIKNVLVNGKSRPINSTAAAGPGCELDAIYVEPGKTYRLRFISATTLSFLLVKLEGHNFTIIEADGAYTKPCTPDLLQIGSGQRYSVLLHTKTQAELDAEQKTSYFFQMDTRERPVNTTAYAVLTYTNTTAPPLPPLDSPFKLPNTTIGWLDFDLTPLHPSKYFPQTANRHVLLSVYQNASANSTPTTGPMNVWSVNNNTPWYPSIPRKPLLVALYENDTASLPSYPTALANGGFDPTVKAFAAKEGEVLDIILEARGLNHVGDIHPFHLHGAHFWDLGSGLGPYNTSNHSAVFSQAYQSGWRPLKRDSSLLYRGNASLDSASNYRVWRVKVTDPGVWMLHCHTLAHMIMGMQSVWLLGGEQDVPALPSGFAQSYLVYGGLAYGNETSDARVVEWGGKWKR